MKNIDMQAGTLRARALAGMQIMHVLIALTLENGLTTVQTMKTRAYNMQPRTKSCSYKLRTRDAVFTLITLMVTAGLLYIWYGGIYNISFYPNLNLSPWGANALVFYGLYIILLWLPLYKCRHYQQKLRTQREGIM